MPVENLSFTYLLRNLWTRKKTLSLRILRTTNVDVIRPLVIYMCKNGISPIFDPISMSQIAKIPKKWITSRLLKAKGLKLWFKNSCTIYPFLAHYQDDVWINQEKIWYYFEMSFKKRFTQITTHFLEMNLIIKVNMSGCVQ